MKKLVLETTSPFQGLPELVAYDEGLFEQEGLRSSGPTATRPASRRSRPRHRAEGRQTRSAATASCSNRARPTCTTPANGAITAASATPASAAARSAAARIVTYAAIVVRPDSPVYTPQQLAGRTVGVPFYAGTHYLALHHARRLPAARPDQGRARADRLAQPLQPDDEGRDRGDDADRALCHARREEGLPRDLLGLLSRHRSRLRPGRRRDLCAPSTARCARRCGASTPTRAPICTTSSTTTRSEGPGDRHAQGRGPARQAASSWSTRRRSRPTRCSAPTTG